MRSLIVLLLGALLLSAFPWSVTAVHAQTGAETPSEPSPRAAWPAQPPSQPKSAWPAGSGDASPAQPATSPSLSAQWWRFILDIQHKLHQRLADAVKALKAEGSVGSGLLLIAVGFLYGVFHAAGPGHGKAVISSYVLANGATVRRGVILSFMAAFVQALSASPLVSVLAIALNAAGFQIQQMVQRFETASGLLIALTGLWLLVLYLRRRIGGSGGEPAAAKAHAHDHGHDHHHGHSQDHHHHHHHHDENCGCGHAHMPDARAVEKNWSLPNAAAIVLAIGIRPCTGAILVLVFALAQGLFWAGVGATFAMAIGTAITVSALAVFAVASRDLALRFAGSRWTAGIYDVAAVGGSLLVMLLGAGLFWSSLGPAKPF
ncbi:MAG: nickel/cobalt transporter [Rhodomicrobium sp.]|nr:nickel/cobalt transporter [Rhodomicrobium sp.]